MSRPVLRTTLAATAAAALLLLAGCAGVSDPASSTAGADAGYVTPGKLTFATGETAYDPYV